MGSYVNRTLGPNESVKYTAQRSLWRYWLYLLIGGLLVLGALSGFGSSLFSAGPAHAGSPIMSRTMSALLVVGVIIFFWPFVARRTTELVVTDKRVIAKVGLLSTTSVEIRFEKIESVRVVQGLIGRMLNYGDVVITGTGSTHDPIPDISSPRQFTMALNAAMEAAKATPS